jgi:hypothetical protein
MASILSASVELAEVAEVAGLGGKMESPWVSVTDKVPPDHELVDVWFHVRASLRSFGWADRWCEPKAWRENGKWFHEFEYRPAELESRYITHWKPLGPIDIESPDSVIWQAVGLAGIATRSG